MEGTTMKTTSKPILGGYPDIYIIPKEYPFSILNFR